MKSAIIGFLLFCLVLAGCSDSRFRFEEKTYDPAGNLLSERVMEGQYGRGGDQELNGLGLAADPNGRIEISLEGQKSEGDIGPNLKAAIEKLSDLGIKITEALEKLSVVP